MQLFCRPPFRVLSADSDSDGSGDAAQNGSVDDALHGRRPPEAAGPVRLDWAVRTRLGCEAAAALQHLHAASPAPLVHGRLQPSAILLDEHLQAKLGDAGVAGVFGAHQVSIVKSSWRFASPRLASTLKFLRPGELLQRCSMLVILHMQCPSKAKQVHRLTAALDSVEL